MSIWGNKGLHSPLGSRSSSAPQILNLICLPQTTGLHALLGPGAGVKAVVDEVPLQRSGFYQIASSQLSGVAW